MKTMELHQMESKKPIVPNVLETFGTFAVSFIAIYLVVTNIFFILKNPIQNTNMGISLVLSLIFIFWYAKRKFTNYLPIIITTLVLFFATFTASLIASGSVTDLSYDGQAYHQEAIILLNKGWNPVYTTLNNEATANLETWLNHYPKGVWIFATGIYKLTGNIEYGKVMSIYSGVIAFAFCLLAIYKTKISWLFKILGILVLVLNPVLIYQSLSYYLDGIVVSFLLCLVAILIKIYKDKDKSLFYPFLFVAIILMNTKLSAPIFALIIMGTVIIYAWVNEKSYLALRLLKYTILATLMGLFFVGYNPYIINFARQGNFFYPTMGQGAIDYVPANTPENLWNVKAPFRLVSSIFAVSSLARGKGQYAEFKTPFTFSEKEIQTFVETNTKTGGFGPFFSGIFVLSLGAFGFYLFSKNISIPDKRTALFVFAILFGMAAIVPTSSVARYVPFIWWIPVLLTLLFAGSHYRFAKAVSMIILLLSALNIALIASIYYPYNITQSSKLENQLRTLSNVQKNQPIAVNIEQFGSTKIKLLTHNISFTQIQKKEDCKNPKKFLIRNTTNLCGL